MFIYHTVRVFATDHTDSITTCIIAINQWDSEAFVVLHHFYALELHGLLEFVTDRTIACFA